MAVWTIVGASVAGRYHRDEGRPGQDALDWRAVGDGRLVLAVADGVSASPRGEEGAATAVKAAAAFLGDAVSAASAADEAVPLLRQALFAAARAIAAHAAEEGAPRDVFDTTLCCAVLTPGWAAMAQIGDGAVVALAEDGSLAIPLPPQHLEFAGEVYSVARLDDQAGVDAVTTTATIGPVAALALTTDGLLDVAFSHPGPVPYPAFFTPVFATVRAASEPVDDALAAFLRSDRIARWAGDDLTLLVAARPSPTPTPSTVIPSATPIVIPSAVEGSAGREQPVHDGQASSDQQAVGLRQIPRQARNDENGARHDENGARHDGCVGVRDDKNGAPDDEKGAAR